MENGEKPILFSVQKAKSKKKLAEIHGKLQKRDEDFCKIYDIQRT